MTNHISRELAEEIAKEAGMAVAPAGNGYWDNSKQLQTLLNLAIDKVIGEVGGYRYLTAHGHVVTKTQTNSHSEPLYALKEVK